MSHILCSALFLLEHSLSPQWWTALPRMWTLVMLSKHATQQTAGHCQYDHEQDTHRAYRGKALGMSRHISVNEIFSKIMNNLKILFWNSNPMKTNLPIPSISVGQWYQLLICFVQNFKRDILHCNSLQCMLVYGYVPPTGLQYIPHKNTERYTVHTIVSWPNPKQWVIVHTSDLMMMIITQSIYIYIYSLNHHKGNG